MTKSPNTLVFSLFSSLECFKRCWEVWAQVVHVFMFMFMFSFLQLTPPAKTALGLRWVENGPCGDPSGQPLCRGDPLVAFQRQGDHLPFTLKVKLPIIQRVILLSAISITEAIWGHLQSLLCCFGNRYLAIYLNISPPFLLCGSYFASPILSHGMGWLQHKSETGHL